MVETLNPATRATELAGKILNAHCDPSQMRHVGNLSESIAEVSITSWLAAY